jgi:CRP-like cAMP-binding protein
MVGFAAHPLIAERWEIFQVAHQPIQLMHPGERTDAAGKSIRNRILASLPDNEFRLIRPHLEALELPHHLSLYEPNQALEFIHFPNDGLVSLVVVLAGGKTVEAGIVGNEGVVGLPGLVGLSRSPLREVVQIAGHGYRCLVDKLQEILPSCPRFLRTVERYAVILGLQVAQTAGCNRLHDVEQRLARWLLMAQDRVSSPTLPITHDFLATMLGTDRPSVSLAAGILQKKQIIEYSRGSVKILNRVDLEKSACECYAVIQQYASELN